MIQKNLEEAIKKSWNKDTCHPPLAENWTSKNPSFGQCAVTSLVVRDYLGGEILKCKPLHHYYNQLGDGTIIDLTKSQFKEGTLIQSDEMAAEFHLLYGESAREAKTLERYQILRKRVNENLVCSCQIQKYHF